MPPVLLGQPGASPGGRGFGLSLLTTLRSPEVRMQISGACPIVALHYAGDEGEVVCGLDVPAANDRAVYASITHLRFDLRMPVSRDIPHTKSTA